MVGYRVLGVSLVGRALGCRLISLVRQHVNGAVAVTTWDVGCAARECGWVGVGAVLAELASLPLLRPALAADGAILLAVPPGVERLAGWRLVSDAGFGVADLEAAARMAPMLADPAMVATDHPARSVAGPMTRRETEVLTLVGEGLTAAAVARRAGISVRTVHKHLEQAYRKLDCHDRLSAVLVARSTGLLGAT
ncbi:response regulator transcription factor [Promicromonospora sp. NFX87]|uniref:response regulator transcription factor n=1 Tax=Promicromonospora sp. NFX87 TaxID=3402691 RepID=UPI003AFAE9FD